MRQRISTACARRAKRGGSLLAALGISLSVLGGCSGLTTEPPAPRVYRVALFSNRDYQPWHDEVRAALEQEGFILGQQLEIEYRYAEGRDDILDAMAKELVATGIDAIVVGSTPSIAAVQRATTTIPIVMAASGDPVGSGFVASLREPGGNITGIATMSTEMAAKRLELLKQVVPSLDRVAIIYDPSNEVRRIELGYTESAAEQLGLEAMAFPVRDGSDLELTFASIERWEATAALAFSDASLSTNRGRFLSLASAHGLPIMFERDQWVEGGGLMSYGPSIAAQYRRAGQLVAKILRGAKPADIPVEIPSRFELTMNLRAAQNFGVPSSILARADRLVE